MKKIITLVLVLTTFVLTAAMEEYDRKSISIFKMDVTPAAITATQSDVQMIYDAVFQKFTNMGRFDYNPIPAGVTNASELFEIVKEYTATKIEERAAKQWDIKNEYYGTNFVTGENVDKIMNGAYILFPRLNAFAVTKKKKGDDFTASVSVSVDVYAGKNTGTVENPQWTPELVKTINASGSNALGSLFDINLNPKKKDKRSEAIKSATNGMLLFLEKELKKIDAFKIKALVTKAEPKKDKIAFNFGKNVGVNVDDAYTVGYFMNKGGKQEFVETGYMKVRKVDDKESTSQLLIVTNPKNEKEDDLFNEYDQCYEYPLVGLNIFVQGGMNSFKFWSEDADFTSTPIVDLEEESITAFGGLNLEYDIAKFVKIPELYINATYDFLPVELGNITEIVNSVLYTYEYSVTTGIAELGFTKKFFSRRLGWYFGADVGYMMMSFDQGDDTTNDYYSVGGKAKVGINYMLDKQLLFDLGAGYRFYGELTDEDGNEVFEAWGPDYEGEGWLTPSGFVVRAGLGFTL
ncbi:MAG: hypothetical protein JXR69_07580 [Candidatus Delongbacteria bacterium]|nr:hypothetical protein [Candidatus Delongbacteria bacterium]